MFIFKFCARVISLVAVLVAGSGSALAGEAAENELSVGDKIHLGALADQFDKSFKNSELMSRVLFVRGMGAKELVHESIARIDPECLVGGKVIYVADISKMPGLIAKMVAIPRMKEYGFPVWLDRKGYVTSTLPVREGGVTFLSVSRARIEEIAYFGSVDALAAALQAVCAPVSLK